MHMHMQEVTIKRYVRIGVETWVEAIVCQLTVKIYSVLR